LEKQKVTDVVRITYANGSTSEHSQKGYFDARAFCRDKISYTGGRVKRVEIISEGSTFAMWDASWDALSQFAGLNN
jgi:hypothetical protein